MHRLNAVLITLFSVSIVLEGQEETSALAGAYDRGLLSLEEPYCPSGNPALLTQRDLLRWHAGLYRQPLGTFELSLSYPVSHSAGLGIVWLSSSQRSASEADGGVYSMDIRNQTFLMNVAHVTGVPVGHRFRFTSRSVRPAAAGGASAQYPARQTYAADYRIGFNIGLPMQCTLGLLSAPLMRFKYDSDAVDPEAATMQWTFGSEPETQRSLPLVGLEWRAHRKLHIAATNRSMRGERNVQIACKLLWRHLILTQAWGSDQAGRRRLISGIGGHIRGFDTFLMCDVTQKTWKAAVSFSPQQFQDVIRVRDFAPAADVLYPYRLRAGNPAALGRFRLERTSSEGVEVQMRFLLNNRMVWKRALALDHAVETIRIPVAAFSSRLQPGDYTGELVVDAYARGRQRVERTFRFQVQNEQAWSGKPEDLIYFLRPDHTLMMQTSRRLIASQPVPRKRPDALHSASRIYRFVRDSIRYVPDPNPLSRRTDRIQYPDELMISRSGDCEDLSVLMVSLLESVGMHAAFLEYVRPDNGEGHVFLMFDTERSPADIVGNGGNLQRYIVRTDRMGIPRCYLPLEMTRPDLTFHDATRYAMDQYQRLAVRMNGLRDGWFRIIDVTQTR